MNLFDEIEKVKSQGYNEANAQAKLGQDIILKAIYDSGMARNATIKGGVVMRSISDNSRRATQDLDLDFIRLSISDESIRVFISRLDCIEGLSINVVGKIQELNHQDYNGKRIHISIRDNEGTIIPLKMDIGVHNDLTLEQEEYAFDVGFQSDAVSLLINSPAQMITEKLKSLLRIGKGNTRYKDIFDIYYLSDIADKETLTNYIRKYIIEDNTLRTITNMEDIVSRLESIFGDDTYLKRVQASDKNWLGISLREVIDKDISFFRSLSR